MFIADRLARLNRAANALMSLTTGDAAHRPAVQVDRRVAPVVQVHDLGILVDVDDPNREIECIRWSV
jgi:hypothetical protein